MEYGVPRERRGVGTSISIYLNDLFNIGVEGDVIGFANNIVFYTDKDWKKLKNKTKKEFCEIIVWFEART